MVRPDANEIVRLFAAHVEGLGRNLLKNDDDVEFWQPAIKLRNSLRQGALVFSGEGVNRMVYLPKWHFFLLNARHSAHLNNDSHHYYGVLSILNADVYHCCQVAVRRLIVRITEIQAQKNRQRVVAKASR